MKEWYSKEEIMEELNLSRYKIELYIELFNILFIKNKLNSFLIHISDYLLLKKSIRNYKIQKGLKHRKRTPRRKELDLREFKKEMYIRREKENEAKGSS